MLLRAHVIQVACTAVAVFGIIAQKNMMPTSVKFVEQSRSRTAKSNLVANQIQSWQSILKDATFRSLVKHTGFTPSLEEKIESDRLVWEKIQSSKFTRKPNAKSDDAAERVKMGVLLDMTPDGGTLEFRQSDRNVYQCPDGKCDTILRRLLAIWKIERFEPSDMWVRIKVPRATKEQEDVYEFTPKHGLQEMNTRFQKPDNQSAPSKPQATTTATSTTLQKSKDNAFESLTSLPIIDERRIEVRERIDDATADQPIPTSYRAEPQETIGDRLEIQTILPNVGGRTYEVNEGESSLFLNQGSTISYGVQPNEPIEDLLESPTSLPILSKRIDLNNLNTRKSISYKTKLRDSNYFGRHDKRLPGYDPYSAVQSTRLPVVFDEPQSKEFFLQMEPLVTGIIRNEPQVPKEFITNQGAYDGFLPSVGPTGSPFVSTISKYAYEITHPSPEFYQTPKLQPLNNFKASPMVVQYSELDPLYHGDARSSFVYEDAKQQQQRTEDTTSTQAATYDTESTTNHTDHGLQEQVDSSVNVLQFAGTNGNEIRVLTKTSKRPTKLKNEAKSAGEPGKSMGENLKDQPATSQSEEGRDPLPAGSTETPTSTALVQNVTTRSELESEDTTQENMMIENINTKTPEEVVHTLTDIGVKNATRIEGYPPVSDKTLEASSKMLEKIKKSTDISDPLSLIVNRVSQSYSYRTAKGKTKNFMKKRRIL